jgi:hypothetical protein
LNLSGSCKLPADLQTDLHDPTTTCNRNCTQQLRLFCSI